MLAIFLLLHEIFGGCLSNSMESISAGFLTRRGLEASKRINCGKSND